MGLNDVQWPTYQGVKSVHAPELSPASSHPDYEEQAQDTAPAFRKQECAIEPIFAPPPSFWRPPEWHEGQPQTAAVRQDHHYVVAPDQHPQRLDCALNRRRVFALLIMMLLIAVMVGAIVSVVIFTRGSGGNSVQINNDQPVPVTQVSSTTYRLASVFVASTHKVPSPSLSYSVLEFETKTPLYESSSLSAAPKSTSKNSTFMSELTQNPASIPTGIPTLSASNSVSSILTFESSGTKPRTKIINSSPTLASSIASSSIISKTASAVSSISTLSHLASSYSDVGDREKHRRILLWQDTDSELIAEEWSTSGRARYRVSDSLGYVEAKEGSPLAAATDISGVIHVFYLNTENIVSHIFETSVGTWKKGRMANDGASITADEMTRLSATVYRNSAGVNSAPAVVLSYQNSYRELRLAISDNPANESTWSIVDAPSLVRDPAPIVGLSHRLGHTVINSYLDTGSDADDDQETITMAVEGENEILPWKCAIDIRSRLDKSTRCWWLNATTGGNTPRVLYNWILITDAEP